MKGSAMDVVVPMQTVENRFDKWEANAWYDNCLPMACITKLVSSWTRVVLGWFYIVSFWEWGNMGNAIK